MEENFPTAHDKKCPGVQLHAGAFENKIVAYGLRRKRYAAPKRPKRTPPRIIPGGVQPYIAVMDRPFPCGVLETSQYGIQLSEDYIIAPIAAFCACLFFTPHFVLRPVLSQLSMQFTSVKFLCFKYSLRKKETAAHRYLFPHTAV